MILILFSCEKVDNNEPLTTEYPPIITKISPSTGKVGDIITIYGDNVYPKNGDVNNLVVKFNETIAEINSFDAYTIKVKVPNLGTSGDLKIKVDNIESNGKHFDYVDIYSVGYSIDNASLSSAVYWKNDTVYKLAGQGSSANGLAIDGKDIYIAGYMFNTKTNNQVAVYWKNGIANQLSNNSSSGRANKIIMNQGDLYVVGWGNLGTVTANPPVAKFWKNGIEYNLPSGNGSIGNFGNDILIVGTDTYIVGYEALSSGKSLAKYWKNGIPNYLTDGTVSASINSLASDGYGNVYFCGTINNKPVVWKNGNLIELDSLSANTNKIAIFNNVFYVVGQNYFKTAAFWKNTTVTELPHLTSLSEATDIDFFNEDIYISGNDLNSIGLKNPYFWRNSKQFGLIGLTGSISSNVNAIKVIRNN